MVSPLQPQMENSKGIYRKKLHVRGSAQFKLMSLQGHEETVVAEILECLLCGRAPCWAKHVPSLTSSLHIALIRYTYQLHFTDEEMEI